MLTSHRPEQSCVFPPSWGVTQLATASRTSRRGSATHYVWVHFGYIMQKSAKRRSTTGVLRSFCTGFAIGVKKRQIAAFGTQNAYSAIQVLTCEYVMLACESFDLKTGVVATPPWVRPRGVAGLEVAAKPRTISPSPPILDLRGALIWTCVCAPRRLSRAIGPAIISQKTSKSLLIATACTAWALP